MLLSFIFTGCGEDPSPIEDTHSNSDADGTSTSDTDGDQQSVEDTLEPAPSLIFSNESISLESELIYEGATTWIGSVGTTIIAEVDEKWLRIDGKDGAILALPEGIEDLKIRDLAHVEPSDILVLTDDTLLVLQDQTLSQSPLSSLFEDTNIHAIEVLNTAQGPIVYFATSKGLSRWAQGSLQDLELPGLTSKDALICGAGSTLWVAAGDDIYRIEDGGEELQAWPEALDVVALTLAADKRERIWLQSSDAVYLKDTDGAWKDIGSEHDLKALTLGTNSETVWLWSETSLWQEREDVARPIQDVPLASAWSVDFNGALLGATEEGIYRHSGGRKATIEGWQEEGVLLSPTSFTLNLDAEEAVIETLIDVDGQQIDVDNSFGFSLDPDDLGTGLHNLNLTVSYSDTELKTTLTVPFEVIVLSWSVDIFPIQDMHCGGCHGATGNVALKLYTAQQWQDAYDIVLPSVEAGFMPPPYTLDDADLDVIRRWALAGFPP